MKKKLFLVFSCLFMIFALTGCTSKTAKTTSEFTTIAKENNMEVLDAIDQFAGMDYVKEATIAGADGWQAEFYVLTSDEIATNMFDKNKDNFESSVTVSSGTSVNMNNYSTYAKSSGETYIYLARVDNTFLYIKTTTANKTAVNNFVKALGY